MKKNYFLMLALFIMGISAIYAQTNQTLNAGQVFTANLAAGAVHTYRIQLAADPLYHIFFQEGDETDIIVSVRHSGNEFYQPSFGVDGDGIFSIRLYDIKNPIFSSGSQLGFFRNSSYIIEVQGFVDTSKGTYKIVFY
jgi:hypothetical protein